MASSEQEIICGIYKITSPSGKVYIGQSVDCIRRELEYKRHHCKRQAKLFSSMKKYGWAAHRFEIIYECSEAQLDEMESHYINIYDCFDTDHGLNLMSGGGRCGRHSKETKERQSEVQRGERNHMYGKPAWNRGITHSEETKIKLRSRKRTPEERKKMSISSTGKLHTLETKLKIGEKSKGNKYSLGYKHPPEFSEKIRLAHLGKKRSEAAKRNMSIAQRSLNKSISSSHKLILKFLRSKLVINKSNGIFYDSIEDAWKAYGHQSLSSFRHKLLGRIKNNTSYVYA